MARTPRDAALFHAQLVGGTRGRTIARDLASGLALLSQGTRIGLCDDLDPLGVERGVRDATTQMIETMQHWGCAVYDAPFGDAPLLRSTFVPVRDAETLYTHRRAGLFPAREAEYAPLTFERLQVAPSVGLDDYLEALGTRERLFEAFDRLFDRIDVLVVPVTSTSPPLLESERPDAEAWDACGGLHDAVQPPRRPGLRRRAGFDDLGLPVGVQIVGRYGTDALVLSMAQMYYDATPEIQGRWPTLPVR